MAHKRLNSCLSQKHLLSTTDLEPDNSFSISGQGGQTTMRQAVLRPRANNKSRAGHFPFGLGHNGPWVSHLGLGGVSLESAQFDTMCGIHLTHKRFDSCPSQKFKLIEWLYPFFYKPGFNFSIFRCEICISQQTEAFKFWSNYENNCW